MSLVDILLASVIFCTLIMTLGRSVASMTSERSALQVQTRLQDAGTRALARIFDDLKSSGFVAANGTNYPYLFEDGNAEAPFAVHAHFPAEKAAEALDPDFGPNSEIVFCRPADFDGDLIPDVDANGNLVWDVDEFSFVVVTDGGINYLQRRVNGAQPRTVASHVERIAFDDGSTSGFTVPLGAVRVRIWFRMEDGTGLLHRYFVESTMKLRNG